MTFKNSRHTSVMKVIITHKMQYANSFLFFLKKMIGQKGIEPKFLNPQFSVLPLDDYPIFIVQEGFEPSTNCM